jgi:hypothetical protein
MSSESDISDLAEESAPVETIPGVAPTGIAPLPRHSGPPSNLPKLYLEFESTQAEPALEKIFLGSGGSIAAAAARGLTDFAISGAPHATPMRLSDEFSTVVRIPVPADSVSPNGDKPYTADFDNRAKLLVSSSRIGAGINGSLVTTVAGQGAIYLSNLFRTATGSTQVPLTYANWQAHSSVVAAANVRLIDEHGRRFNVHFRENKERDAALKAAEDVVGSWANGAWQMRQSSMRYPHSPTLTKAVARVPCGINDSGYNLVHNVVEPHVPYSGSTIHSMMENAVQVDLEFIPEDIAQFLGDTKQPGKKAASWGRTLAASLSMLGNFLVSYRADGRTRITPEGSDVAAAESWLDQAPRDPCEGNDCDGSGIVIASLARAMAQAPEEVLREFEYINAAKNMIVPHFTIGVSVLGASSAEASSGGGAAKNAPLAGHAAAIMLPTLDLLNALEKGGAATVGGTPVLAPDVRESTAEARFKACFSDEICASLPEEERAELRDWSSAKALQMELGLSAYGIEGTTPASPILYASGEAGATAASNAKKDEKAFAKAAPNIGRSIKILHQGGHNPQCPHKFYADFVEFNLGRSHPLWVDPQVRSLNAATTQIVFGNEASRISGAIEAAGVSPRFLVTNNYTAVPLVTTNTETAALLDYASQQAELDIMPPREPCTRLSPFLSKQLGRSLTALSSLDEALKGNDDADGHCVAYMLAYSTLVNNPLGVEHLCSRLRAVAATGMVDALDVRGLAQDDNGAEAGKFVVINALIPVE